MIYEEFSKVISKFCELPTELGKKKTFYGFVWAENSCAFDTISTILMYSYRQLCHVVTEQWQSLNNWHLSHFELVSSDNFSSLLLKIDVYKLVQNASKSSVYNLVQKQFPSGIHQNIDQIFLHLINTLTDKWYKTEHPFFQLLIQENYAVNDVHKVHSVDLPLAQNDSAVYHGSVQNIISNKFQTLESSSYQNRPTKPRVISYNLIKSPYILAIKIVNEITICPTIKLFNVSYTFFAIVYMNINHFIAVIKIGDTLYEYDGLSDEGKFKETEDPCLTDKYKEAKAIMSFYLKDNLSDL